MNSKSKVKKSAAPTLSAPAVIRKIQARARSAGVRASAQNLLVELCRQDTTARPDVAAMRAAESRCFEILERELEALPFAGARLERRPVNPAIQNHPHFSLPGYTRTPERPDGLSPEAAYAGRANLVFIAPGAHEKSGGASLALNAHLDVVAPYFPPRVKGGIVFGRGACDDKGPAVALVAALKILAEVMPAAGLRWNKNVVAMFVLDEEIGGNGSLSLATDRELKKLYDSVMVVETCGLNIYPANRGAVWYRAEVKPPAGVSAFEMSAFVIEELEREGAAIRAESRHRLFPARPVQTNHGMLGPFGEMPSRICGRVVFKIQFDRPPDKSTGALIRDCLESGLANYAGLYGDKTKVTDPATGKPMVARHYDLRRAGNGFEITVHGATGHMGAVRERDGAITKTAHLVRSLVFSKAQLEKVGGAMQLQLGGNCCGPNLILEGGQGFLPTHPMAEIMERVRRAAERGAENYLRRCGRTETGAAAVEVAYNKLHNAAFDGDPDSPAMRHAIAAARRCGFWKDRPVVGYPVSCDARLFATEYPGMPVLTSGPGELAFAHSDAEQIALQDIAAAAEFLALFMLRQTGTLTTQALK